MNTQQLTCFVCVADKLNFTKAAEELFLSPSTVTHHIKTLEQELSVKLFFRTSKIVQLTEAGMQFYEDAKELLDRAELAQKKLLRICNVHTVPFRIGCTSNTEQQWLEIPLRKLRMQYPEIHPHIVVDDYYSLKKLFENKQLDVLLVSEAMTEHISKCIFKPWKQVGHYAVFSDDSSLKEKEVLSFSDLMQERLITLHPKWIPFRFSDTLRENFIAHAKQQNDFRCENDQSGLLLAKTGYGVVIFPENYLPKQMEGMAMRPIEPEHFGEMYGIAYSAEEATEIQLCFVKAFLEQEAES